MRTTTFSQPPPKSGPFTPRRGRARQINFQLSATELRDIEEAMRQTFDAKKLMRPTITRWARDCFMNLIKLIIKAQADEPKKIEVDPKTCAALEMMKAAVAAYKQATGKDVEVLLDPEPKK